ncbi:hypothetical protein ACNKHT_09425 [Shigella flexneri]
MEAYKHLKPIALAGDAREFKATIKVADQGEEGIVEADSADGSFMDELLTLMAAHRVRRAFLRLTKFRRKIWIRLASPGDDFLATLLTHNKLPTDNTALSNCIFQRR